MKGFRPYVDRLEHLALQLPTRGERPLRSHVVAALDGEAGPQGVFHRLKARI